MIKNRLFALLLAPLFLFTPAWGGYDCCDPCYTDCCDLCSDWDVYGEWIYWSARRCDLDYAVPIVGVTTSVGDVLALDPEYQSGFRVGVQKGCGKFFFDAFYTYYRADVSETTARLNNLAATRFVGQDDAIQPPISVASGAWDLDYDVVDLLVGHEIRKRACFQAYIFGGLKLAFIDQKMQTFYSQNITVTQNSFRVTEDLDMDAYGVNLGLGARYAFWRCLHFFGRTSYDVLVANFDRRYVLDFSPNGGVTFINRVNLTDDCWALVGTLNLSFGVGYEYFFNRFCCSTLALSLGYEFHRWANVLDFLDFQTITNQGQALGFTFDRHLQSLGFDGLFLRLSLGF